MNAATFTATVQNKGTYYTVAIENYVDATMGSDEYYMRSTFCVFGNSFMTENDAKSFAASKQVQKVVKIANA
jgi:hypothetical protein